MPFDGEFADEFTEYESKGIWVDNENGLLSYQGYE